MARRTSPQDAITQCDTVSHLETTGLAEPAVSESRVRLCDAVYTLRGSV